MGTITMILSAASGALFGHTYKRKVRLGLDTSACLVWFSFSGTVLFLVAVMVVGAFPLSAGEGWIPVAYGASAIVAMRAYYRFIETARLGISWTVIQMSVVIPFISSLLIFRESIGLIGGFGVGCILAAIVVLGTQKRSDQGDSEGGPAERTAARSSFRLLFIASFFTGVTSTLIKAFSSIHTNPSAVPTFFLVASASMLFINVLAFLLLPANSPPTKRRPQLFLVQTVGFGVYAGTTNTAAMVLLLLSAQLLPGYFLFPVRNITNIIMVLGIATLVHGEKIQLREGIGVVIAVVGIGVLSLAMRG
jgi:drug/metabolite transporter (DMT)-like permease